MTCELVADFSKQFGSEAEIHAELNYSVEDYRSVVLFGPSGCGKTTILRCLAGLERPERGSIRFDEQIWFDQASRISLRPQHRSIGYLSQEYALFPHLTVENNIGYGLPRADRRQRVGAMMEKFDLLGLERRYPHQVSGGQQQRVALARSLACRPRLLLLDEPLSALDTSLRDRLRTELRRWLAECRIPAIVVTHDRTEAIALGDQICVMEQGRVLQFGPPDAVFSRPKNLDVARIVGVETVALAEVVGQEEGLARISIQGRQLLAVAADPPAQHVYACIRAEDVVIRKEQGGTISARNRLAATIRDLVPEGPLIRVTLDCGFDLIALVTRPASNELELQVGDQVEALVKVPAIHLIRRPPAAQSVSAPQMAVRR